MKAIVARFKLLDCDGSGRVSISDIRRTGSSKKLPLTSTCTVSTGPGTGTAAGPLSAGTNSQSSKHVAAATAGAKNTDTAAEDLGRVRVGAAPPDPAICSISAAGAMAAQTIATVHAELDGRRRSGAGTHAHTRTGTPPDPALSAAGAMATRTYTNTAAEVELATERIDTGTPSSSRRSYSIGAYSEPA